jgi:hypothetical protein
VVARRRLERELGAKSILLKESNDHDTLWLAVGLVLDDLGMTSESGTSSMVTQVISVRDRARRMVRQVLHLSVQRSFAIACSHYEKIDLQAMSQGFAPGYDDAELDQIEEEVAPLMQVLAASMEEEVVFKE